MFSLEALEAFEGVYARDQRRADAPPLPLAASENLDSL